MDRESFQTLVLKNSLKKDLKIFGLEFFPTVCKLKRDPKLSRLYF
jgi:hypothetical protein